MHNFEKKIHTTHHKKYLKASYRKGSEVNESETIQNLSAHGDCHGGSKWNFVLSVLQKKRAAAKGQCSCMGRKKWM